MNDQLPNYTKIVDLKRLSFVVNSIEAIGLKDPKVLDVGCGNGIISMQLGQRGYSVHGVDVSKKAIAKAKEVCNLNNVTFDLLSAEELEQLNKSYDVIVCSEVLEHLDNPGLLLETLRTKLTENGILVVTVPNGFGPREALITKPTLNMRSRNNWIWKLTQKTKSVFGYSGSTVQSDADNLDHIQFFSRRSLTNLLNSHGFQSKKFGHANFFDDVFPFSFFTNRIKLLQKIDCKIADLLPSAMVGGYFSVWKANPPS